MSRSDKPIVVAGSINMDLVAGTRHIPGSGETVSGHDFQTHPGGKGANQAVAVARLGYPVCMIGRVGSDAFGTQLRDHLTMAGVDVSALKTSEGPSGIAVIIVAASGENSIVVVPGANAHLLTQDIDDNLDLIQSAGMVLTQLETPLETVLHLARVCGQAGVPMMLDPAPACDLPAELLQQVSWFTPNESEAAFFLNERSADSPSEVAQQLRAKGCSQVVLKLGVRGAYVSTGDASDHAIEPFVVNAVDTTAAGDCFNGAFATALCMGNDPATSARFAAAAAAIAVTRAGAQPSMPTAAEVKDLLSR